MREMQGMICCELFFIICKDSGCDRRIHMVDRVADNVWDERSKGMLE